VKNSLILSSSDTPTEEIGNLVYPPEIIKLLVTGKRIVAF